MMTAEQLKPGVIVRFEDGSTYDVLSIKDNNVVPNPIVGIVEDIDANGVAKIRVTSMGRRIAPEEKISFTVTDGPMPSPAPYRSLDANHRTSSEEWKQSVRGRDLRWVEGVLP